MNDSLAVGGIIKELQSANLSQDLILDTIDGFNYTLASNIAKQGTTITPKLVEIANDIKGKFDVLIRSNIVLAKRLTENKLQEREDRGELLNALGDLKPEKTKPQIEKKEKSSGALGIFGTLGVVAGFLTGTVTGFLKEFTFIFSGLITKIKNSKLYKTISNFFTKFGKYFDDIVLRFKNSKLVTQITNVFKGIGEFISKFKNTGIYKGLSTLFGKMKMLFSIFSNSPVLKAISGFIDIAKSTFSSVMNLISGMKTGFAAGSKFGSILGKLLKGVGRLFVGLGKIFGWPLTIILGLYGAITGFMRGYKEGGMWEGIKEGLVGLYDILVGSLLDLIKDGISWVADMLGFENFSKMLDGFSFTAGFRDIFNVLEYVGEEIAYLFTDMVDWFKELPDKLGQWIKDAFGAISSLFVDMGDTLDRFNRTILKAILPDPNAKRSWYNPLNLIKEAIPDDVYKYAYGSPPKRTKPNDNTVSGDFTEKPDVNTEEGRAQLKTQRDNSAMVAKSYGFENQFKAAQAAGFSNAQKWREAGMPDPRNMGFENVEPVTPTSGAALKQAGNSANATVINVTNNNGGNVNSSRSSNVNNNVPVSSPIYTGGSVMMGLGY